MQTVSQTLENLNLGQPAHFLNLTVFPLLADASGERSYMTLREAVESGQARVREVSEDGSVPELLFENNASRPVLILDGEELVGAKQNRIANVTILAPANKTIKLPVSCVEAGRWGYRGREFEPSEHAMYSEARRRKTVAVSASLRSGGARDADQSEVWDGIAQKAARMSVDSSTDAMADIYEQHASQVTDYVDAFTAAPNQVGAVFAIGEQIEGLDLFDSSATFAEMLAKLIRSYAIDAVERPRSSEGSAQARPSSVAATAFILRLARVEMERYPAVGLGTEVRLTAPGVVAAGLVEDERVVHLVGFSAPAQSNRQDSDSSGLESMQSRRGRAMGR